MDFHVGQTFGDYAVTGILGAGGFGRVYKVEHLLTKRTEAMKVLASEYATETQFKRFKREMLILARLNHPNISVLHNATYTEKQLVLFMAFIEGQTLETMFAAGRLPLEPGIGYIKQILLALEYAHQQGVVHRDVTPANVIITASGEVKLTDFGLSKAFGDPQLTGLGEIIGALPYLAPEQLKSAAQPDRRSDLYSVGAILYELLTGQKPFGANRRLSAVLADSESDPKPPSQVDPTIAPEWDEITRRALARDPVSRYQSAGEFLNAIAQIGRAPQPSRWIPHARALGLGVAVSASLLLAMAGWSVSNRLRTVTLPISAGQRLHIAPPNFAWVFTRPSQNQSRAYATPRIARRRAVKVPSTPAAPSAEVAIVEPEKREEGASDTAPAAAPAAENAIVVQPSKENKRRFWSKFNVFKKNKSVAASNPVEHP